MSKRKRDPTFTTSEKLTLINVVESHFNIIESKKTDSVTSKNKSDEWRKIEIEFNAISSMFPRNYSVLKNCWENLKKKAKLAQTVRNQHYLGTGGGPPKKDTEDPCIERVLALIQSRVSGFINVYDSDGTSILASRSYEPMSENGETETIISDVNIINTNTSENIDIEQHHTETAPTETVDWAHYTPSMLRNTISTALTLSPTHSNDMQQVEQQPPTRTSPLGRQLRQVSSPRHRASTSRRRPNLRNTREVQSLAVKRISTLELANSHAQEEHDYKMKILKLQEEQESLKVKQEILKLKTLEVEYNKIKQR